jgi:hypothetical protein
VGFVEYFLSRLPNGLWRMRLWSNTSIVDHSI